MIDNISTLYNVNIEKRCFGHTMINLNYVIINILNHIHVYESLL